LPAPQDEKFLHIDDDNVTGSTKSELKDVVPMLPKAEVVDSHALNKSTIKRKVKHRKRSHLSDLKLYKNPKRLSQTMLRESRDRNRSIAIHSKSELNQHVNFSDEFEFPIHNNLLLDIENDHHNNSLILPIKPVDSDIRTYEIDDEILGKIIVKTRVIESTEKLKREELFKKSLYSGYENKSAADVKSFLWDNIDEYRKKEARLAIKEAAQPKVSSLNKSKDYVYAIIYESGSTTYSEEVGLWEIIQSIYDLLCYFRYSNDNFEKVIFY
jgi:hypothetical protein